MVAPLSIKEAKRPRTDVTSTPKCIHLCFGTPEGLSLPSNNSALLVKLPSLVSEVPILKLNDRNQQPLLGEVMAAVGSEFSEVTLGLKSRLGGRRHGRLLGTFSCGGFWLDCGHSVNLDQHVGLASPDRATLATLLRLQAIREVSSLWPIKLIFTEHNAAPHANDALRYRPNLGKPRTNLGTRIASFECGRLFCRCRNGGCCPDLGCITGTVSNDGIGNTDLSNIVLTLCDESVVVAFRWTNSLGNYEFKDVPVGDYVIEEMNLPFVNSDEIQRFVIDRWCGAICSSHPYALRSEHTGSVGIIPY